MNVIEEMRKTRLITALKTPYPENGKFDLYAYDVFLEKQIENGVEVSSVPNSVRFFSFLLSAERQNV